jgi:hypothetical protein
MKTLFETCSCSCLHPHVEVANACHMPAFLKHGAICGSACSLQRLCHSGDPSDPTKQPAAVGCCLQTALRSRLSATLVLIRHCSSSKNV